MKSRIITNCFQVSDVAEPETINRVYRMLAQRYHPDNRETGNEARFRAITEAYTTLTRP
jgi:DnaJ-class molecular chaperone